MSNYDLSSQFTSSSQVQSSADRLTLKGSGADEEFDESSQTTAPANNRSVRSSSQYAALAWTNRVTSVAKSTSHVTKHHNNNDIDQQRHPNSYDVTKQDYLTDDVAEIS